MQKILVLLLILFLILFFSSLLFVFYKNLTKVIKYSITPHFVNIMPNTQQFIDLILAIYNLKKHTNKLIAENNIEDKCRPIKSNFLKIENIFNFFGFETIDYTNQKYNEGMNVEVVSTIKSDINDPIIKETIEPSIIYNGELLRKAKIIKEIKGGENE